MLFFPLRGAFTLEGLFGGGEDGALYKAYDISTLFQESAGTTPVTAANDPIGLAVDQSGNSNDALQTTASRRPTYQITPARMVMDKSDDRLVVDVTTGGWTGSMVLATDVGTATYDMIIPAGDFEVGAQNGTFFPGGALVGMLLRKDVLSAGDAASAEQVFVDNGAVASYGANTNFRQFWKEWREISVFPLIDVSSGTNFESAWQNCKKLTSFPALDVSAGTHFGSAWNGNGILATFPANMFDSVTVGEFSSAFSGTALSETSIDNVLVSLDTANITSGVRNFLQSGGTAPSVGTGRPAIDSLRTDGWTIVVTGGY